MKKIGKMMVTRCQRAVRVAKAARTKRMAIKNRRNEESKRKDMILEK